MFKIILKLGFFTNVLFINLLIIISIDAFANDDLRGNVSFGYSQYGYKDYKSKMYNLESMLYLSPVKKANHPWLEAAFLERTSNIGVTLAHRDAESTDNVIGADSNYYSLSGQYASTSHPVIVTAAYAYTKSTFDRFTPEVTTKTDSYSLSIGSYLGANTALTANYSHNKYNSNNRNNDSNKYVYGISVRSVLLFSNRQALSLSGGFENSSYDNEPPNDQSATAYFFTPIYYITQTLSIELPITIRNSSFDYSDEKLVGIGVHGFIGPHFSAELHYSKGFTDDSRRENYSIVNLSAFVWF